MEQVQRAVEIEASPEEVWESLATEEGRESWLEDEPGREVHVEVVQAPSRMVWWWWNGDEPATRVELLVVAAPVGARVAVIGAGGIGFDVSEFLVHGEGESPTLNLAEWQEEWGVGDPASARGGVVKPHLKPPARAVTLLQRKEGRPGKTLGKTTGWIHRAALQMKQVQMLGGASYDGISEAGLHVSFGEKRQKAMLVEADTIVICAGQEPLRELEAPLVAAGVKVHRIGGADVAAELDAKRAINQGTRLAMTL